MIRRFINFSLLIILGITSYQVYNLYQQKKSLQQEADLATGHFNTVSYENEKLKADVGYFQKPENLKKELRSRFNYINPGERVLIIIPE